jgi:hypothetical protein
LLGLDRQIQARTGDLATPAQQSCAALGPLGAFLDLQSLQKWRVAFLDVRFKVNDNNPVIGAVNFPDLA